MVSAQQGESLWIAELEQDEVSDCLDRGGSAVHIVAQEEVIRVWDFTTNFEKFDHVKELSMNVSHNSHWRLYWAYIAFCGQDLFDFRANYLDCDFFELFTFLGFF